VPLLAAAFGGRASVGIMLPMLIIGDCFAVAWYRRHAQWSKLVGLLPWLVVGMGLGAGVLWLVTTAQARRDVLSALIGGLILLMLGLHVVQRTAAPRLAPKGGLSVAFVGTAAGFATTVSNAAGPIMNIYLTAHRLEKHQFIGTGAWYYLVVNLSKLPVYIALSAAHPLRPIITARSVAFALAISPAIIFGVIVGRRLLPRFSQNAFDSVVLTLSGIAAAYLIAQVVLA
jgi:hypothetical protein